MTKTVLKPFEDRTIVYTCTDPVKVVSVYSDHEGEYKMNKLLEAAIEYAKRGWPVLPLHYVQSDGLCSCGNKDCNKIAKHPLTAHGVKDATRFIAIIKGWWTEYPNANIGIATGQISGIVVVDIDTKNNGFDSLEKLEAEYVKLPQTITVTTGSMGKHYYFKGPNTIIKNAIGIRPGIDIRGDGGYVVAPPSTHASGNTYKWDNIELLKDNTVAELPLWFIGLPTKNAGFLVPSIYGEQQNNKNLNVIPEGKRNGTLTSLAGSMHHRGMSTDAIREALYKENEIRCVPPLSQSEIDTIINSISKYDNTQNKEQSITKKITLTKLADLIAEPEEEVSYIVERLLPSAGISLLAGKPKVGKTTLVRMLALCIAQGEDFLDRIAIKGLVIYLALEEKRAEVRKHFIEMGLIGDEDIYIHAASVPDNAIKELYDIAVIRNPKLIIIDPLFRFIRVRDGNDYASVTKALEPLVNLARDTGAHVMCVHHLGKGDRSSADSILGSTAIFAAVDTALILKSEKYRTIYSVQRYGTDLEESVLEFDPETRTSKISGTKDEAEIQRIGEDIYAYLATQEEPILEKEIHDQIKGGNKAYKVKALRVLVDAGRVKRTGKGGKGDPYHYSCSVVPTIYQEQENKKNEGNRENKENLNLVDEEAVKK